VTPLHTGGHALAIQWLLDDSPIAGATGATLNLASLALAGGTHTVSVRVTDPTLWVRNEAARAMWMTETRSWSISPPSADIVFTGTVDANDLLLLLALWGPCTGCGADLTCDGAVDVSDLLRLLAEWG
jgi:hypothetical protein